MKMLNFAELKSYILSNDLHFGVHCTDINLYQSIKKYGVAHDGKIDSTVNFSLKSVENIKNLSHKQSNCEIIIAIPKKFFNFLYQNCKSQNINVYESDFFCKIAPKNANLTGTFVIDSKYVMGVFDNKTQKFSINENFICEQHDFKTLIDDEINRLKKTDLTY